MKSYSVFEFHAKILINVVKQRTAAHPEVKRFECLGADMES